MICLVIYQKIKSKIHTLLLTIILREPNMKNLISHYIINLSDTLQQLIRNIYIYKAQTFITTLHTIYYKKIHKIFRIPKHIKLTKTLFQQTTAVLLLPFFCLFCGSSELLAMNNGGRKSPKNPCVQFGPNDGIHQNSEGSSGGSSPITTQPQPSGFGSSSLSVLSENGSEEDTLRTSSPQSNEKECCPPCDQSSLDACLKGACIGSGLGIGAGMIPVGAITGCTCPATGSVGAGTCLGGSIIGALLGTSCSLCKTHGCQQHSQYIMCDKDMAKVTCLGTSGGGFLGAGISLVTSATTGTPCPDMATACGTGTGIGVAIGGPLSSCLYATSEMCCQSSSRTTSNISEHQLSRLAQHYLTSSTSNLPITTQPQSSTRQGTDPHIASESIDRGNCPSPCCTMTDYTVSVCTYKDPCDNFAGWATCGSCLGTLFGSLTAYLLGADVSTVASFASAGSLCTCGMGGMGYYYKKYGTQYLTENTTNETTDVEDCKICCKSMCEKVALGAAVGTGVGCIAGTCTGGAMSHWDLSKMIESAAAGAGEGCSTGGLCGFLWWFLSELERDGFLDCCLKKHVIKSQEDNQPITEQPQRQPQVSSEFSEEDRQCMKEVCCGATSSGLCNCCIGGVSNAIAHGCGSSAAVVAMTSGATGCATGATCAILTHCLKKHHPEKWSKIQQAMHSLLTCVASPITSQPQPRGTEGNDDERPGPSSGGHGLGLGPEDYPLLLVNQKNSDTDTDTDTDDNDNDHGKRQQHGASSSQHGGDSNDDSSDDEQREKSKGKGKGKGQRNGEQQQPSPTRGPLCGIGANHGYKCYDVAFIPGYNRAGQISSLQSMQSILLGSSEQVLYSLRLLALKAYTNTSYEDDSLQLMTRFTSKRHMLSGPHQKNTQNTLISALKSYVMFGFIDNYTANLERKCRGGRIGIITSLMPNVRLGLAYNRNKEAVKEHIGMRFGTASGSVKAQTTTDSLSTVISWNTEDFGFTGHLASCYGWGKVKTNRYFTHGDSEVGAKGKPDISLGGGLFQLGYNLPITKHFSFTPYIEYMLSTVSWSSYHEKTGPLPCKISQNKEYVMEQSIGLRNQWKVTTNNQLQTWVSVISGKRTLASIYSKPLIAQIDRYKASIPTYKKRYVRTELGLSYEANLIDTINIGLNTSVRLEKTKRFEGQQINTYIQYTY